ncbi:hypothetical protein V7S57_02525 [Caulobacter sp. CCNWLY153]|uniref:hypothetical protein n=1 Tax=unclassified Caulobacter TaxID=2648921 RepID=UPI002FEF5EE4
MTGPLSDTAKGAIRAGVAVAVIGLIIAGLMTAAHFVSDPLGSKARRLDTAQTNAVVAGQQAASNGAGAAINDRRATNVANIQKTAQEARYEVATSTDHDDALRRYLAGLERVRHEGAAGVADPAADDR